MFIFASGSSQNRLAFTDQFSRGFMELGQTFWKDLIIAFFLRRNSFNFMAAVTIAVTLEPKKIKSVTVSIVSPSICHEVMGPDAMILIFEC